MFERIHPVTISARAVAEIRKIMATKNIPEGYGLRLGVKGGGCGVTWLIGFDKRKDADIAYEVDNIPVYIDKKHTMYIIGKEVDFHEDEESSGFTFVDARSTLQQK